MQLQSLRKLFVTLETNPTTNLKNNLQIAVKNLFIETDKITASS